MGFIVTARRLPSGLLIVEECPSCGRRHVHKHPGTHHTRCGMTYEVLAAASSTPTRSKGA